MADYTTSALVYAQTKIAPKYNEAELRERQNPILRTGLANQDYVMANIQDIKKSTKRTVKGYQWARTAAGNGTTRSHNFTGTLSDTSEVTLSWGTYSEVFGSYLKSGADNIVSNGDILANQIKQAQRVIRERLGAALLASLHAGRTTVANSVVRNASWNSGNYAFEISNKEQMFAYMRSVLNQHKYYGNADVIVDSILDPIGRSINAQGASNAVNQSYQLNGFNIMPHDTLGVDVAVSAYPDGGIGIAIPENSFCYIPFVEEIYRKGWGNFDDFNGGYTTMPDDTGLPLTYMLRGYAAKADGSSNGGTTDDVKYNFQISCDVATQIAQVTSGDVVPVLEFALMP